jgi:hypothetical protein
MLATGNSQDNHHAPEWLSRYANGYHQWRARRQTASILYHRPLGFVEGFFDADGTDYEGRADLNAHLILEARCSLSEDAWKRRVCLAWTVLRTQHALLSARALSGSDFLVWDRK